MDRNAKIYVAGHTGLVGSAVVDELHNQGYNNLVLYKHSQLDLKNLNDVDSMFNIERPKYVFLAAAKVGGIYANNTFPADFIYDNISISSNVIHISYKYKIKKLINLGSSCIFPKNAPQPLKEEYLLSGKLESTNEPYAIAKIAAIIMCRSYNRQYGTDFISAMPTNLYGVNDNFDVQTSHVLPSMLSKFHEAKMKKLNSITLWGTGSPRREFLISSDLAKALIFLMNNSGKEDLVNIGCGKDISIRELAYKIKEIVEYDGTIVWDKSMPDGTYQKLLDTNKINAMGWYPEIFLDRGIKYVYTHCFNQ